MPGQLPRALGFSPARRRTVRLGALVTGVIYRNIRASREESSPRSMCCRAAGLCGIGAGWFEREHKATGGVPARLLIA